MKPAIFLSREREIDAGHLLAINAFLGVVLTRTPVPRLCQYALDPVRIWCWYQLRAKSPTVPLHSSQHPNCI